MNKSEYRESAHKVVDWMADYLGNVEILRCPDIKPGDIKDHLSLNAPEQNIFF
ncbi:MAG: hypothetical protein ABI840_10855 [bacterium]